MICPACHGRHFIFAGSQVVPCEECAGLGKVHCCDGLQAQPESARPDAEPPPAPVNRRRQVEKAPV